MTNKRIRTRVFRNEFGRRGRWLLKDRSAVYHVMSRTVRREFWFGEREKEVFVRLVHKQAAFTGVQVLAYCVMSNHFHLLLRVPVCPWSKDGDHRLTDTELLKRYEAYYGEVTPQSTYSVAELRKIFAEGTVEEAEEARRVVMSRMGDLPAFMRELKQRFVFWFNDQHENEGTIWSARYKSLLVEDSPEVLTRVAAYIDLNPVRASVVDDPGEYRWCGYAACMAGASEAQAGLLGIYAERDGDELERCLRGYRMLLFGKGACAKSKELGRIDPQRVAEVIEAGGEIPEHELLRCRIPNFSGGRAVGSRRFLGDCFGEDFGAASAEPGPLMKAGIFLLEGVLAFHAIRHDWKHFVRPL